VTDYNAGRRFARARLPRLFGTLPGRSTQIRGVFLHSTRSGRCGNPAEAEGTENWLNNPNNPGGAWDGLIGYDGEQVKCSHWERDEQPLWAGGFGGPGTWSAQANYLHIEICQPCITDPYTDAQVESVAQWTAELARVHGFDIVRIPYLEQVGEPPQGVTSHDSSANGRRLGKSDPGPLWPWDRFIARARQLAGHAEEDTMGMTPAELERLERLERLLGANGIDSDGDRETDLVGEDALAHADKQGWSAFLGIGQGRVDIGRLQGSATSGLPEHTHTPGGIAR
jgi:N-acetylmuramoyl-L-alanine amidase